MSRNHNYHRGSYEEYDHSDQELAIDDQCCGNCCYYECGFCNKPDTNDYNEYYDEYDDEDEDYYSDDIEHDEKDWCDEWKYQG